MSGEDSGHASTLVRRGYTSILHVRRGYTSILHCMAMAMGENNSIPKWIIGLKVRKKDGDEKKQTYLASTKTQRRAKRDFCANGHRLLFLRENATASNLNFINLLSKHSVIPLRPLQ